MEIKKHLQIAKLIKKIEGTKKVVSKEWIKIKSLLDDDYYQQISFNQSKDLGSPYYK
jgi:hypothetical protein